MEVPSFSIIIPTYNSAKTLNVCLDSIFIQSYLNFEIIIIDGCSTDSTLKIIEKYAGLYPSKIKWFSEKDKGIYDAMNKGIRKAKGDWIYFLGSDDRIFELELLNKIKTKIANAKQFEIIYGNVISTRFNGIYGGEFTNQKIFNQNICHQSIFFKKSVFKKIGNFNIKFKIHADWDHNLRWFLSKKILKVFVDITCAEYADGGFSSTNNDLLFENEKKWKFLIFNYKKLSTGYKYLITKNILHQSLKNKDFYKLFSILIHCPLIFIN